MTDRADAGGTGVALQRPPVDLEIVVPAADEEERLGPSLATLTSALALLPLSTAVVVVDNASTDLTAEVARAGGTAEVPVHVVACPAKGKGYAVQAGVLTGCSTWTGFMDADLATDLSALPIALAELGRGRSVVIGSRALPTSTVTARHRAVRRLGARVFRHSVAAVVPGVADSQCGFKFFDGVVARDVFADLVDGGFAFDVEVLARCRARGLTIVEIPVSWDDQPGSTFRPARDGWRSFWEVWRIARRMRRVAVATPPSAPSRVDLAADPQCLDLPAAGRPDAPVAGREAELATGA